VRSGELKVSRKTGTADIKGLCEWTEVRREKGQLEDLRIRRLGEIL